MKLEQCLKIYGSLTDDEKSALQKYKQECIASTLYSQNDGQALLALKIGDHLRSPYHNVTNFTETNIREALFLGHYLEGLGSENLGPLVEKMQRDLQLQQERAI